MPVCVLGGISFFVLGVVNLFTRKKLISKNNEGVSKDITFSNKDISLLTLVLGIMLFFGAPYLGHGFLFSYAGLFLLVLGIPGTVRNLYPRWFYLFSLTGIVLTVVLLRVFGFF